MRKNLVLSMLAVAFCYVLTAQSVGINNNTPHSSAMLDVKSTNKGILVPRMTTVQRNAITTPADGLLVYDTDSNSFWFYNGTVWTNLSAAGGVGWSLTGNSGTNAVSNFIGTTDAQPFRLRANNLWAGEIEAASSNIFLGLDAGKLNTTGRANTALGSGALSANLTGNNNVAVGDSALFTHNGGGTNVAVGTHSLYSTTTGVANTAVGPYALFNNTTGGYNTAIGVNTLANNITGVENVALGSRALQFNTGNSNTATGASALRFNGTGSFNTANGYQALYSNSSGFGNTAEGYQSLYANSNGVGNTATGQEALKSNDIGYQNTAYGYQAMLLNTTASENTAVGAYALRTQSASMGGIYVTGNVAIGFEALYSNNPQTSGTGNYNTAVGHGSMKFNTWGNANTATGYESLSNNSTGANNTADGYKALNFNGTGASNTAIGVSSLYNNSNGNANTALGYGALDNNIGGSRNIAVGFGSGTASGNLTNTISIGNEGYLNAASNQAFIGNLSTLWNGGNQPWSTFSDARMKTNITQEVKGLDFILRLRPVTYNRSINAILKITGGKESNDFAGKYDIEKAKESGFLAQEVVTAAKEAGYDFSGVGIPKTNKQLYTLSYEQFVVPIVKAMQEQQAMIQQLQAKASPVDAVATAQYGKQQELIAAQQKDIELLKLQVKELKATVDLLTLKKLGSL